MDSNQPKSEQRIYTGIFLVVGGLAWLAYRAGAPLPEWMFTWESGLIYLGLFILVRHNFRNLGGWIMVFIGGINLLDNQMPQNHFHNYIVPLIVVWIGILYIVRPRSKWRDRFHWKRKWQDSYAGDASWKKDDPNADLKDGDDYIEAYAVFSGIKTMKLSKNFKGGEINCVFGGGEIDLTQSDIQDKAIIELKLVFGGVKLLIPPHWVVQNEIAGVFHGVDDKRPWQTANIDAKKVLVLHGSCVFAGIEIRSY